MKLIGTAGPVVDVALIIARSDANQVVSIADRFREDCATRYEILDMQRGVLICFEPARHGWLDKVAAELEAAGIAFRHTANYTRRCQQLGRPDFSVVSTRDRGWE